VTGVEIVSQSALGLSPPEGAKVGGRLSLGFQRGGSSGRSLGIAMDGADDGASSRGSRTHSFDNGVPDFAKQAMADTGVPESLTHSAVGVPPLYGTPGHGRKPSSGSISFSGHPSPIGLGSPRGLLRRNDSTASDLSLEKMAAVGGIRLAADGTLRFDDEDDGLDYG